MKIDRNILYVAISISVIVLLAFLYNGLFSKTSNLESNLLEGFITSRKAQDEKYKKSIDEALKSISEKLDYLTSQVEMVRIKVSTRLSKGQMAVNKKELLDGIKDLHLRHSRRSSGMFHRSSHNTQEQFSKGEPTSRDGYNNENRNLEIISDPPVEYEPSSFGTKMDMKDGTHRREKKQHRDPDGIGNIREMMKKDLNRYKDLNDGVRVSFFNNESSLKKFTDTLTDGKNISPSGNDAAFSAVFPFDKLEEILEDTIRSKKKGFDPKQINNLIDKTTNRYKVMAGQRLNKTPEKILIGDPNGSAFNDRKHITGEYNPVEIKKFLDQFSNEGNASEPSKEAKNLNKTESIFENMKNGSKDSEKQLPVAENTDMTRNSRMSGDLRSEVERDDKKSDSGLEKTNIIVESMDRVKKNGSPKAQDSLQQDKTIEDPLGRLSYQINKLEMDSIPSIMNKSIQNDSQNGFGKISEMAEENTERKNEKETDMKDGQVPSEKTENELLKKKASAKSPMKYNIEGDNGKYEPSVPLTIKKNLGKDFKEDAKTNDLVKEMLEGGSSDLKTKLDDVKIPDIEDLSLADPVNNLLKEISSKNGH